MFRHTRPRIMLHWAGAALLLVQYLFNEPMAPAGDAWTDRGQAGIPAAAWLHITCSVAVLLLALMRNALRFSSPAG